MNLTERYHLRLSNLQESVNGLYFVNGSWVKLIANRSASRGKRGIAGSIVFATFDPTPFQTRELRLEDLTRRE